MSVGHNSGCEISGEGGTSAGQNSGCETSEEGGMSTGQNLHPEKVECQPDRILPQGE